MWTLSPRRSPTGCCSSAAPQDWATASTCRSTHTKGDHRVSAAECRGLASGKSRCSAPTGYDAALLHGASLINPPSPSASTTPSPTSSPVRAMPSHNWRPQRNCSGSSTTATTPTAPYRCTGTPAAFSPPASPRPPSLRMGPAVGDWRGSIHFLKLSYLMVRRPSDREQHRS
jgi:hypothetical protein